MADARRANASSIRFAKGLMLGILLASISIALIAALYVSGYVTGNIHAISDAMQRLAQGDRSTRLARTAFAMPAAAAGLTAGFAGQAEITGNDGRILEVRCNRQPDGGETWLFSDTTERHNMEERLAELISIGLKDGLVQRRSRLSIPVAVG